MRPDLLGSIEESVDSKVVNVDVRPGFAEVDPEGRLSVCFLAGDRHALIVRDFEFGQRLHCNEAYILDDGTDVAFVCAHSTRSVYDNVVTCFVKLLD